MDDQDRITCPQSGESLKPEKVWETKDPSGKPQRFGVLKNTIITGRNVHGLIYQCLQPGRIKRIREVNYGRK